MASDNGEGVHMPLGVWAQAIEAKSPQRAFVFVQSTLCYLVAFPTAGALFETLFSVFKAGLGIP